MKRWKFNIEPFDFGDWYGFMVWQDDARKKRSAFRFRCDCPTKELAKQLREYASWLEQNYPDEA